MKIIKPKIIFYLALIFSGNCGAAIIYPKPPDGGREIVAANVAPILQQDARFFDGLKMEDLRVAGPYREYYVVDLTNLVAGHLLSGVRTRSWKYLLMHGTNAIGATTLIEDGQNTLKYNDVQRPFFADAPLEALRVAENLPQIKDQDYEVRSLSVTPLNFTAVWLHGRSNDIILPLPPTFGRFHEKQPYSESQITSVLKKDAEDAIKQPNLAANASVSGRSPLELTIETAKAAVKSPEEVSFSITFHNNSVNNLLLNGGEMLGNGSQLWSSLDAELKTEAGQRTPITLHWGIPGVDGRIYFLGLPLRAGSSYTLLVRSLDFYVGAGERLKSGKYEIQFIYHGRQSPYRDATQMPVCWEGEVHSNVIKIEALGE